MSTQITRTEVVNLIDRLADKTLSFGCKIKATEKLDTCTHHFYTTVIDSWGHPEKVKAYGGSIKDEGVDCVEIPKTDIIKILGHPFLIGDMLEKMKPFVDEQGDPQVSVKASSTNMMRRWNKCGIDKSLQEIVDGVEWITETKEIDDDGRPLADAKWQEVIHWKYPEARALFEFLLTIFK